MDQIINSGRHKLNFKFKNAQTLNEVTTTPSTVADSEILMHRRRSQIPKY